MAITIAFRNQGILLDDEDRLVVNQIFCCHDNVTSHVRILLGVTCLKLPCFGVAREQERGEHDARCSVVIFVKPGFHMICNGLRRSYR